MLNVTTICLFVVTSVNWGNVTLPSASGVNAYSSSFIVIFTILYPKSGTIFISFWLLFPYFTVSYGAWSSPEILPPLTPSISSTSVVIWNSFNLFSTVISEDSGTSGAVITSP